MASLLPTIPVEFMNPLKKYALMNYLVDLGLPARVSRLVLQQWGEAMNVTLYPTDYELLQNHFKTTKG